MSTVYVNFFVSVSNIGYKNTDIFIAYLWQMQNRKPYSRGIDLKTEESRGF